MHQPRSLAALVALALLLPAACAQGPARTQSQAGDPALIQVSQSTATVPPALVASRVTDPTDPLESTNRAVFDFNLAFDDNLMRPLALGYRELFHPWVRERIRNVVNNAHELRHSGNALLQGEPIVAGTSLMRFVINTTLGLGGMFDLASIGGPPHQPRDFGQTLHRWGVPDGPFLMLPVIGPTNSRDLVGRVADGFMNPVSWYMPFAGNIGRGAAEGLDLREQNIETLDALRDDSLDFYARVRSIWQQRRAAELGRSSADPGGLDVLDDPDAPAPLGDPLAATPRVDAAPLINARPIGLAVPPQPAVRPRPRPARPAAARAPARPAAAIPATAAR